MVFASIFIPATGMVGQVRSYHKMQPCSVPPQVLSRLNAALTHGNFPQAIAITKEPDSHLRVRRTWQNPQGRTIGLWIEDEKGCVVFYSNGRNRAVSLLSPKKLPSARSRAEGFVGFTVFRFRDVETKEV
jgi:hypothetical protein